MELRVGTSGYSYAAWKGRFYPAKIRAGDMLGYYAERFPTVELNHTFRGLPDEGSLARLAEEAPPGFVFALKAPQQITHYARLRNAAAPVAALLERAAELGRKRGPILFQLPPNFKKDEPLLAEFLALLPRAGARQRGVAFEFRHPSWFDDGVYALLKKHRAALCLAEDDDLQTPRVATAPFGYLRLRRARYDAKRLAAWAAFLDEQPWREAFVYFKHEDTARGPRDGARLMKLVGAGAE